MDPRRGDVFVVALDPTQGREIKKARPCVIVSPDELNRQLGTFIVAPMTTDQHNYPYRIGCRFQEKDGFIVLEQLRTVDRGRLSARLGRVSDRALESALAVLREMFSD
jgi:mRNA interferase MazF